MYTADTEYDRPQMSGERPNGRCRDAARLHYDRAPRPITAPEARVIADDEYRVKRTDRGYIVQSLGADGGFYPRGHSFQRESDANADMVRRVDEYARRIMAGECPYTIFYDPARDRFYSA